MTSYKVGTKVEWSIYKNKNMSSPFHKKPKKTNEL